MIPYIEKVILDNPKTPLTISYRKLRIEQFPVKPTRDEQPRDPIEKEGARDTLK